MEPKLEPFFEPAPAGGARLYIHHTPPAGQPVLGAMLYVHPWADEMNKSRRMASLACRALAANGFSVLQVDLLGCGDSSGDFGDANWEAWVDDIVRGAQWLQRRHTSDPIWLWGLRAGTLLAASAAHRIGGSLNFLLWQPVPLGKVMLQQFLRLKAAAHLLDGGGKSILDAARNDLANGRPLQVAGYLLTPGLAKGLEAAQLTLPVPEHRKGAAGQQRVVWLEVTTQAECLLSPVAKATLLRWQNMGWMTSGYAVTGPPFWQTTEIEEAPALLQATCQMLSSEGVFNHLDEKAVVK